MVVDCFEVPGMLPLGENMYQLFCLHLLYSRHLLDVQNEQMKQMQANLVSTIKRSSSVNNEVIEYNRKLQQVSLPLHLLVCKSCSPFDLNPALT